MSGFSTAQLRKLTGKLDRRHVHFRKMDERDVDYIEGWFAIAEANAIFGFGGWDREMTHFERVFERTRGETTNCSYIARVCIRVRAGGSSVVREGTGWGTASARNAADAHERAIKSAETDATKRALATFGNRIGLGLYDKEQAGVTPRACDGANSFEIIAPDASIFAATLSAEGFCSGLRRILEGNEDRQQISLWLARNLTGIGRLKVLAPALKSPKGEHYGDLLARLFQAKIARLAEGSKGANGVDSACQQVDIREPADASPLERPEGPAVAMLAPPIEERSSEQCSYPLKPSNIAYGPRIDKAGLSIRTERRQRDKDHLRHVATLPCLVCQAAPSHPHHLTFAQPRGLALKVSDEFVVPLCAIHHNDVHREGAEALWWKRMGLEPLEIARALWAARERTPGEQTPALESARV